MNPEVIEQRIDELMRKLTLREKISLLSGRDSWATMPIERLNIPALVMTDGPHGARSNQPDAGRTIAGPTTAFPTGVSMASTWNPALVEEAGRALGEETKAMGCDILLGPCVNIVRTPIAGRNFEAYGEDPYLTGRIGVAYVKGVQSAGAGTSLKHYAANNQEIERYRGSSEVDERTLREIYLPHFETIVKEAHPWTVMCSYNRINGVYASQNHHLLNEILKEEWGFEGVVVSDWTANHTITESVEGGLDLEMPGPAKYYGSLLMDAVNIWQIEESTIDQAARRVLRMLFRSGKMDATDTSGGATSGGANTPEHQELARRVAEEAITLLKNAPAKDGRPILPLRSQTLQTMAVIGPAAEEFAISGGGSAFTEPPYRRGPLAAIREQLGSQVEVRYEPGCDNWIDIPVMKAAYVRPSSGEGLGLYGEYFSGLDLHGKPFMQRVDPRLDFWWFSAGPASNIGARFSARWNGKLQVPASGRYTFSLGNTGTGRLLLDGEELFTSASSGSGAAGGGDFNDIGHGEAVVQLEKGRAYDLRIELNNSQEAQFTHIRLGFAPAPEGAAPANAAGSGSDPRIERAVAIAREAEVAVVFVGTNEQFETEGSDRPDLKLPGLQNELVRRVAEANPNTIVVLNTGAAVEMPWIDSVAAVLQAYFPGLEGGAALASVLSGAVNPSGKLVATYPKRLEDTASYPNLSIPGARQVRYGEGLFVGYRHNDLTGTAPLFPFGHGLSYTSFEYSELAVSGPVKRGDSVEVSLKVTNTGSAAGKEVVQIYVRDVQSSMPRPYKELKGFQKVDLAPGETKTLRFTLDARAFSSYDVLAKDWVIEAGEFEILAAASSADVRQRKLISVEN